MPPKLRRCHRKWAGEGERVQEMEVQREEDALEGEGGGRAEAVRMVNVPSGG